MRENNFVESRKALIENRARRESEKEKLIKEYHDKRESFMNNYHSIRESREQKLRLHGKLMEACRNESLATAIKAIYITALEAGTLTDDGIILAENMVDKWIEERGGASKILSECSNKTYLLARIAQIVEEAAILETEDIENADKELVPAEFEDKPVEDEGSSNTEVDLAVKVIQNNIDTEDEEVKKALDVIKQKAEGKPAESEAPEEEAGEENKDESDNKTEEDKDSDSKDSLNVDFEDFEDESDDKTEEDKDSEKDDTEDQKQEESKEDESEEISDETAEEELEVDDEAEAELPDDATDKSDDNESDVAEDIIDDLEEVPEEDLTIDGEKEDSGKVFNELEKEKDVKKAIELIRQRVADAEETFIKRNAEDKKQIDELIGKISDNVKTVEDLNDENSTESKIAQESVRLNRQKMKSITENRPLSIMEKLTRNLHANIIKDEVVKEHYLMENGNLDTGLIVEAAKVMYGFLETLNTLQLEKVDAKYIEKVLNDM